MKSLFGVTSICVLIVIVGVGIYFSPILKFQSAQGPQAPIHTQVQFTEIQKGILSSQNLSQGNYRIVSAVQLSELWGLLYGVDAPNPPYVDFSKNEVLVVVDAVRPTAGFTLSIESVQDTSALRTITIAQGTPDDTCTEGPATGAAFEVIVLPKTALPISHEFYHTSVSCK